MSLKAIIFWVFVVGAFIYAWRKGHILRLRDYIRQTEEELKKCTWPTWDELKGSTVVVAISMLLLGVFTVVVDIVFGTLVRWIT